MSQGANATVTFLLTDIEGSTKLWEEHPETMKSALSRHDDLLRHAIEAHDGHVFKTVGDGFFAAFANPQDALSAGVSAQLALQSEKWGEVGPLRVRMALHTGSAQERDDDYFGPTLNRVARLLSAAHGGQVLISRATAEIKLRNLGEHRLRDLAQPERVFQLVHPDLPAVFPAINSLDNLSHNLPRQLNSFIGREREMAEIKRLLPQANLLTLTGVGGCGKTRLALQIASEVIEDYPDGVWLVELALVSDPALVPQSVAQALGMREVAGQTLLDALIDHLQAKQVLLILDNCEHLLSACAQLTNRLLRACPNLRILASSRAELGIAGELTYRVPPLSLPDPHQSLPIKSLTQYEAVHLFQERAIANQRSFRVTEQNAQAVVQICRELDGIPLAIELAAARTKALSVQQIARRLQDRFALLTEGKRAAFSHHQTLRATMDWSYELLSPQERTSLRRVSVFVGGFTLEAAEQVCTGKDLEENTILDRLTHLLEKSLVIFEDQGGEARYKLLETVRRYGQEKLMEAGERAEWHERHRDFYLKLAEQAELELDGPNQESWFHQLEVEHGNLRAALQWSLEDGKAEKALRIAGALGHFWDIRDHFTEGLVWLERALEKSVAAPRQLRAKALRAAGVLAWCQGKYEQAKGLQQESLKIYQEIGDTQGIAMSLNNLGNILYNQGDYEAARDFHRQSLVIRRGVEDKHGIAVSLNNLGNVALDQSDYQGARRLYRQSLAIRREIGDQHGIAVSLHNLGMVLQNQGDYERARRLYEESLEITRAIGDKKMIAHSISQLAGIVRAEGQLKRAAQLLGAVAALLERLGAVLDGSERSHYEQNVLILRNELGEKAFQKAFAEGRASTTEQAINLAGSVGTHELGDPPP